MEHKSLDQIRTVARLETQAPWPVTPMTKRERLERWADLLAAAGERRLQPLKDVEFVAPRWRAALRADNSPLALAYEDPMLRTEGLRGDSLGDAIEFFGLTDRQAHHIVCACHYVCKPGASEVAYRVRHVARPFYDLRQPQIWVGLTGAMVAATAILSASVL